MDLHGMPPTRDEAVHIDGRLQMRHNLLDIDTAPGLNSRMQKHASLDRGHLVGII